MIFADVFFFYIFKAVVNWVRARGSRKWPSVEATVLADPDRNRGVGCLNVEIFYSYRFDGELYTGSHDEPFLIDSTKEYAARFPKDGSLVVRVKPGEPEVSVVRDEDQATRATVLA